MQLDDYYEWLAVERARSMQQPLYSERMGAMAYHASQTAGMKVPKPDNVDRS
jgi:hypothetical protein